VFDVVRIERTVPESTKEKGLEYWSAVDVWIEEATLEEKVASFKMSIGETVKRCNRGPLVEGEEARGVLAKTSLLGKEGLATC